MTAQLRNEYVAVVMSAELLLFCRENELPYISVDDLLMHDSDNLTDKQIGWLTAFSKLWDALID